MRLLDDAQWERVSMLIDREVHREVKRKRDSYALSSVGYLQEPKPDIQTARYYAGYASACHDISNSIHRFIGELEEVLHSYYDDEADVREFCEEDESCDD